MSDSMRLAKQSGSVLLLAGLGISALLNPIWAVLGVVGVFFGSVLKSADMPVPSTKRRKLEALWSMYGAYAITMAVLGLVSFGLALYFTRTFQWGLVAFFTLAACWLPVVAMMTRRRKSY